MIENIIKKFELIKKNPIKTFDVYSKTEPEYENNINLEEFFRNNLIILIFFYSFALIVFITEILFSYFYRI